MTGNSPPTGDSQGPAAIDWAACLSLHEGWLRTVILARTGEREGGILALPDPSQKMRGPAARTLLVR